MAVHGSNIGRVRDAGADAALIVDALKVPLAVWRRSAFVAFRALFSVRTRAAAHSSRIPLNVRITIFADGKLFQRALDHRTEHAVRNYAEGTKRRGSFDEHPQGCRR